MSSILPPELLERPRSPPGHIKYDPEKDNPGSVIVWFGEHKGREVRRVPKKYIYWISTGMDSEACALRESENGKDFLRVYDDYQKHLEEYRARNADKKRKEPAGGYRTRPGRLLNSDDDESDEESDESALSFIVSDGEEEEVHEEGSSDDDDIVGLTQGQKLNIALTSLSLREEGTPRRSNRLAGSSVKGNKIALEKYRVLRETKLTRKVTASDIQDESDEPVLSIKPRSKQKRVILSDSESTSENEDEDRKKAGSATSDKFVFDSDNDDVLDDLTGKLNKTKITASVVDGQQELSDSGPVKQTKSTLQNEEYDLNEQPTMEKGKAEKNMSVEMKCKSPPINNSTKSPNSIIQSGVHQDGATVPDTQLSIRSEDNGSLSPSKKSMSKEGLSEVGESNDNPQGSAGSQIDVENTKDKDKRLPVGDVEDKSLFLSSDDE